MQVTTHGPDSESNRSLTGFLASIITLFVFITGIYSLPKLVEFLGGTPTSTLSGSNFRVFSIGLLMLSQVAYFSCLFVVLRLVYLRFRRLVSRASLFSFIFVVILSFAAAVAVSFVFAEAYWGKVAEWPAPRNTDTAGMPSPHLFTFISGGMGLLTILAALESARFDSWGDE